MSATYEDLKTILGSTYGGPSLSYEDGNFIIYDWGDAPVNMNELGKGDTILAAIEDFYTREAIRKAASKSLIKRNKRNARN